MQTSDTITKHREYLFPAAVLAYQQPIALDRGQGVYVWDETGRRYLDCFGGVLTVSVGHAHPKVVQAIIQQVNKISHTSTLYANRPQADLAEKLAQITPGNLSKCFFTSSGSEANETAIAVAKHATGRHELIVLRHGYSGRSAATMTATGQSTWRSLPAQVPGIVHAHAPYCYRCPFHLEYPGCDLACAQDIEELIQTATCGRIAGFLAESILGIGGFIVPPPGYFERVVQIVRNYGGLFICDEVQAGWGRSGDKWFAIEHWNVVPDILTSAKGMGNGTPVAVTITTPQIAEKYPAPTFATFGGNPVSAVAALATISVIEQQDLKTNARIVGNYLRRRLEELKDKYSIIGDVRGMGLMQGLELVKDRKTKQPYPQAVTTVFEETKKRGVLIGKSGLWGHVLRIGLPLIAGKDHVDELIAALDPALQAAIGT